MAQKLPYIVMRKRDRRRHREADKDREEGRKEE